MPRWLQLTLHGVLIACNVALAAKGILPPMAALGISALQAGIGAIAQEFNTDGSPQETPFSRTK